MPVPSSTSTPVPGIAPTSIEGLDDVLAGGLARKRLFLVEGMPGSGKTTLALQVLRSAAARGEPVLYVTLSETEEELRAVSASHGWTLDGVTVQELIPSENSLDPEQQYTLFHASEVELGATIKEILLTVDRLNPTCVVFDSLSELRLLAGSPLRYRRQILALKQFFASRGCTALLLDDMTATDQDLQTQSIAHGVIRLEQVHPDYGSERRRLRVTKYRGTRYRGGYHDYVIERGGLRVFPRLVAAEHRRVNSRLRLASGVPEMDALLGGGLEEGTSTLIVGAAGTGKSTLAAQFATAAADARTAGVAVHLRRESGNVDFPVHGAGYRPGGPPRRRADRDSAGRSRRAHARRVHRSCPRSRARQGLDGHHRQPQRLPERHAR